MIDVLVATVDSNRCPGGLSTLPYAYRVLLDTRTPWAAAANALLDQAAETGHDALFVDDDVEILPGALAQVVAHYDQADLFGISLVAPNGGPQQNTWYVQSAGHMLVPHPGGLTLAPFHALATAIPCLVFHAGTCCMYIKHRALADHRVRFPEHWTGVHHEDIFFCLMAWLAGYKVARLPAACIHWSHPIGAGATKATLPNFHDGREQNMHTLIAAMNEADVIGRCARGEIPVGMWAIDGSPLALSGTAHLPLLERAMEVVI